MTAGGALTVTSSETAAAASKADGSATGGSAAIGAGVAITLGERHERRRRSPARLAAAASVDVEATSGGAGYSSEALSGAAGSVSVAGSLGADDREREDAGAAVRRRFAAPSADVTLKATSTTHLDREGDGGHDRLGRRRRGRVEPRHRHDAGGGRRTARSLSAHDLTLHATSTDTMTTTSQTGAAGGGVAIVPSVAVSLSTVTTDASLGTGAATTLGGALTVAATQTASVTTTASGFGVGLDGGGRCGGRGDRRDRHA